MTYDSILFGNGLTIAIHGILKNCNVASERIRFIDYNSFFHEFLLQQKLYNDFDLILGKCNNEEHIQNRKNTLGFIMAYRDVICKIGFERWVSKYIFDKELENQLRLAKPYIYALYNYWYSVVHTSVFNDPISQKYLSSIASTIKSKVTGNIYTLNFDKLLDSFLNIKHIHGVFTNPFSNFNDIILYMYNEEKSFEYKYLFGANGLEKANRLFNISNRVQNSYYTDFLFNNELNLGHLLIYGVSFSRSDIMTDEFLKQYPQHSNDYFVYSVDGHILFRLNALYNLNKVNKITLAYYCDSDLIHYKSLFAKTNFESIIEYRHCNEIFPWKLEMD